MAPSAEERQRQDEETLYAMGRIFCRAHHAQAPKNDRGVCEQCDETVRYSLERTAKCPHQHKGNCKDCSIHCHKPEMRARIREIMAYGAPRMTYQHPIMTGRYLRKKINGKRAVKKAIERGEEW